MVVESIGIGFWLVLLLFFRILGNVLDIFFDFLSNILNFRM